MPRSPLLIQICAHKSQPTQGLPWGWATPALGCSSAAFRQVSESTSSEAGVLQRNITNLPNLSQVPGGPAKSQAGGRTGLWAGGWDRHHRTMRGNEGEPTGDMRVPPSFMNFPVDHEGDSSPWLASRRSIHSHHMPGHPVPILLCAGHTPDTLGLLGQPDMGAHPGNPVFLLKKPRIFSRSSWPGRDGPRSLCRTVRLAFHLRDTSMRDTDTLATS